MQLPVVLNCQPSPRVGAFYFLLHGMALGALWLAAIPAWVGAVGAAGLAASAVRCVRQWRAGAGQWRLGEGGAVELRSAADAGWLPATVGHALVWPWLLAVRLKVDDGDGKRVRGITLLRGDVDAQTWRRAAVWFRWSSPAKTDRP